MARRWKVLLVTSIAAFMGFLDVTIVNIAFPDLRTSFAHASLAHLSWVLNAYNILFAAALVPAGRLADRFGRRRFFFAGVLLFLASSAVCGLAWNVDVLIAARALQAVGGAILVPTSLGLILPEFPLEQRATATALWGATGAVAAATGPSLGGVLVDWQSWRWVFFVNLLIGLPALVPARRLLVETRDEQASLPDPIGALLLAGAVAVLSLAIVEGPSWGWSSTRIVAAFVSSAVLAPLFVARSARHRAPIFELALFRVRSFAVANAGVFTFSAGFYALLLGNVLFLTGVWHYSVLHAGVSLTPGPLMAALAAPIGGRLADKFGQRVVAVPGGLIFAAGALVLALSADEQHAYASHFLPGILLTGAGVGLSFSAFSSAAVAELPRTRFATGSAISATSRQIGAVVGIASLIAILGTPRAGTALHSFHRAWLLMVATGVGAAVVALALGRVRARHVEVPEQIGESEAELLGVPLPAAADG
ncbi:MAG: DHA2 family efflux MFS transporter permease subunit [Actinomycetota bacterium]|nr:DHA2 family efflux MFS transporter permease subunit [Actinomycetota bacterium]